MEVTVDDLEREVDYGGTDEILDELRVELGLPTADRRPRTTLLPPLPRRVRVIPTRGRTRPPRPRHRPCPTLPAPGSDARARGVAGGRVTPSE